METPGSLLKGDGYCCLTWRANFYKEKNNDIMRFAKYHCRNGC